MKMMYLLVHVVGIAPLMTHNGRMANPLDEYVKAIGKLTAKGKKKTEEDHAEIARLEFLGGLYIGENGEPCIPGEVIEGFFGAASKSLRMSKEGKAGISSHGNWPLIYDGPHDPNKMWESGKFTDIRAVKIKGSKVMRCRAIFHKWELKFEVMHDADIIDREAIVHILGCGCATHGFCDYTPKFGRFGVESVKDIRKPKAA